MLELKDGFVFYHGSIETHIFENGDVDWFNCIEANSKKIMFIEVEREMARYDIIAGKIADDATNATLTAYLAGAFGTGKSGFQCH